MNISLKLFDKTTINMAFMAFYKPWTPSFFGRRHKKTRKLMTGIIGPDIIGHH